jgi:hypothetical protein
VSLFQYIRRGIGWPAADKTLQSYVESRDRELEFYLREQTLDWSAANGHATDVAAAVGSIGGGTNWGSTPATYGRVKKGHDGWVDAVLRITAGGAGVAAGAAGYFAINLPYPTRHDGTIKTEVVIGEGWYYDASSGNFDPVTINATTTAWGIMYYAATHLGTAVAVSNAVPWALATGDAITFALRYEAA